MKKTGKMQKSTSTRVFIGVLLTILIFYALTIIIPLVWALITSFKSYFGDYYKNKIGLPVKWMFSNYLSAIKNFKTKVQTVSGEFLTYDFLGMAGNSILYAVGCSLFSTLIPCITGYAMAKFRYKFSDVLYVVVLITMALPIVGNLASEINMARALGIYDTFFGIWIMSANFAGQYTLVFFATFRSIPGGYAEAAEIDGANEFVIMVKIMLPLVIKTFGAIMLIKFIAYWNEYESAMIYLKSHPVISYGIWAFNGNTTQGMNGVPMKLTGCMLLLLPVLVIFLIFQNKLMGNVSMGGIKG